MYIPYSRLHSVFSFSSSGHRLLGGGRGHGPHGPRGHRGQHPHGGRAQEDLAAQRLQPADRDALPVRHALQRLLRPRVQPEEGLRAHHLGHARLRQPVAEGHLPAAEHHLLGLALHHAGHRHREVRLVLGFRRFFLS